MTAPSDLRELEERELIQRIAEARRELFGLRFSNATGELENTAGLRAARRELARAMTVARERGITVPTTTAKTTTHG